MFTVIELEKNIEALKDSNPAIRKQARYQLIEARQNATPLLLKLLKSDQAHARWEAVNILKSIGDPTAANTLVEALLDDSLEVHWMASEALIALGQPAILPLLKGIVRHFDSYRFRQGAYHILHTFERFSTLDNETRKVLNALRDIEPGIQAPWAAERAIEVLEIFAKK
jgi:hypothetical protein